jgi:lipoate-protein ligase A
VRAPAPSLAPCFAQPVEGEVVAGGHKLVGSAQRRLGSIILQHGSLPIEDDQSAVATFLVDAGARDDAGPPATLAQVLGRIPGWEEIVSALAAGWMETFDADATADALTGGERVRAEEAARRYAGAAWTWHQ